MSEALSRADLQYKVKDLRKLANKEGQASLKNYYLKELAKYRKLLSSCIKNDSGYVAPRSAMTKLPSVKWEATS